MTEDEKFYLAVEAIGLETAIGGNLPAIMAANPKRGFLYLFDTAYAMGFGAAQKMVTDGTDILQFDPEKLSLIPRGN